MWFKKKNKLSKCLHAVFHWGTLQNGLQIQLAYPTRSHLQTLTHDRISKGDQHYVLLMTTQNLRFAKL